MEVENINKMSQKLLSQIAYNISFIDGYARNYNAALYSSPTIAEFMYKQDPNIYDTLQGVLQVQYFLQTAPFIYSVTAFNRLSGNYYVIGPDTEILSKDKMYDREIVEAVAQPILQASPLVRRAPVSSIKPDSYMNLYSYWVSQTDDEQNVTNGLVINVDTQWIFQKMISSPQHSGSMDWEVLIIDQSGTVVGHSEAALFLQNKAGEAYIRKIMSSSHESDYFVEEVNGEKSVVVFSSIEQMNWKIINVIPYSIISQSVNKIRNLTLVISLMVFAMGLFGSYILARRLYSPIGSLRERIGLLLDHSGSRGESGNEFQFIESNVVQTVEHLHTLKQFKSKNLNHVKTEYLKSLLLSVRPMERPDDLELRIGSGGGWYILVLLKLDQYNQFRQTRPEGEQAALRFALVNISHEILSAHFQCECVDMTEDCCIIIRLEEEPYHGAQPAIAELDRLLARVNELYNSYFHVTFSSFKTRSCPDLSGLQKLFAQARQGILEKIRYGHACTLSYLNLQNEWPPFEVSDPLVADFMEKLKGMKRDSIAESLERIIGKLYRCEYDSTICLISHMTSSIFNFLNTLEKNGTVQFHLSFPYWHKQITELETLSEMESALQELLDYILGQIAPSRDARSNLIVEGAVQYLKQHYRDVNLTQQSLADTLKISSFTLGKMFREATGMTVIDYLKEVRLQKAVELLKHTNYTVSRIVDEIGWGNRKYFSTVFKQVFGVTPMDYRLKNTLQQSLQPGDGQQ
jgi:AraC-like DNA-binding protein